MDEIGKNISGAGFDTNAVGRYYSPVITAGPPSQGWESSI
jgi:hypothetical protein